MFNFTKSRETPTLSNKTDVQYKVLCDWLRSTSAIVKRIERRQEVITVDIAKLYDLLLKDDSPPDDIEIQDHDNSGNSESI